MSIFLGFVKELANSCGYKNVDYDESTGNVSIYGGKPTENFYSIEECKKFLLDEKRRHERLVKEMRESYIRIRQRKLADASRG